MIKENAEDFINEAALDGRSITKGKGNGKFELARFDNEIADRCFGKL